MIGSSVDREKRAEEASKLRVEIARLRRRWIREGYDPRAHLYPTQAEGQDRLFSDWILNEHLGCSRRDVTAWLAASDMADTLRWAAFRKQRVAA